MKKLTALLAALACASLLTAAAVDVVETENAGEQDYAKDVTAQALEDEIAVTVLTGKGTDVPNMPAKAYDNAGNAGSVTLTADRAVTWDYSFNGPSESDFAITKNDTAITFTSNKNIPAGEIYVTAYSGPVSTATTVFVYGDNKWSRGEDLITGTRKPLDFENFTLADGGNGGVIFSQSAEIVNNPGTDDVNNSSKVMKFTADRGAFYTTYHAGLSVPKNRALSVYYKYYLNRSKALGTKTFYFLLNTADFSTANLNASVFAETSSISGTDLSNDGKWAADSFTVIPGSDTPHGNFKNDLSQGVAKIGLDSKWWKTNGAEIYVDDFSVVPMWKVTYMDADNATALESKWICRDENGNVLVSFNPVSSQPETLPSAANKYFAGWSQTKGALEADTEIKLSNSDIVLYPVFKEVFKVTASAHTDGASADAAVFAIPAKKANSYITLTADANVTWSYTFSKNMISSQFTVNETANTIKFTVNTANANAGEITVKASATDAGGTEHVNTYTVYVYGNNTAVPGLDITTGTEKAFDFENIFSDANSGMMSANGNIFVSSGVAIADSPDGNGKVLAYNWANANFFTTYHGGLLTEKRPFNVSYKYYLKADASVNALNVIVNTDMPYQISGQPNTTYPATTVYCKAGLDTTKNKWISENVKVEVTDDFKNLYKFGLYYNATNPNGTTAIYVDDFGVMPYYAAKYHADTTLTVYFLLDDDGNVLTEYTPVLPSGAALTVPDGKVLAGWTTVNGGTEAMKTIALNNADIDLYPVFADKDFAPHWYNDATDVKDVTEIRVQKDTDGKVIDTKSGLRFKGYIEDTYRNDEKLYEYGFIVARTDVLGKNELTHEFKTDAAKNPYISQANYSKYGNIDLKLSYDTDLEATVFSCVLVNIPVAHYGDKFTVRAWSNLNGKYKYGTQMSVSILDILNSLDGERKDAAQPLIDKYNEWLSTQAEG